ncbi:MAG: class I SAM-dependent methyltransferase [Candidatus Pacebacteria bacterium]|nr:class I SAM-dependent methyltransferase [Candidatus Paceibacterota bacterium]
MLESCVIKRFEEADILIGGERPWDIRPTQGNLQRFCANVALKNSLGLGESYMHGLIECDDVSLMLRKLVKHRHDRLVGRAPMMRNHWPSSLPEAWIKFQLRVLRRDAQSVAASAKSIGHHYDNGNGFYQRLLGKTGVYSCGFFEYEDDTLDQAQNNKIRRVAQKLDLVGPGKKRVLEIGCGWGYAAALIAEMNPHVTVVGITISKEQYTHAVSTYEKLIRAGRVEFYLMDYRRLTERFLEPFDAVYSIGMFEHVGPRHYSEFARIVRSCIEHHRPFVLHTIVGNGGIDPFIWYHIFPGGILPTVTQIAKAFGRYFEIEHGENLGPHYALTLRAWRKNLRSAWGELLTLGHAKEFLRMYEFYLAACEAAFAERQVHLWQFAFSVGGLPRGLPWNLPIPYSMPKQLD